MLNTLLGTKKQMSQAFVGGTRVPVTKVLAGPCVVTQVKTKDSDGYWAVQIGFADKKIKNTTKPLQGHLKGATKDKKAPRFLREVRMDKAPEVKKGDVISVSDVFKKGDVVSVTGVSKGKGFAGVIKRWGFASGPRTHGQSDRERAPGSIGQGTTPGRVRKGKKMPGRMGGDTIHIKNLIVVDIDEAGYAITLSGPVPGPFGNLLVVKKIGSGKLEELVQEAPEVQEQEVPEEGEEGEEKKEEPQKEKMPEKPAKEESTEES